MECYAFRTTNAVPAFQPVMNEFLQRHQLKGINVYMDNLTVGGMDQKSHDENLSALKEAAKIEHFTFNEDKCQSIAVRFNYWGIWLVME